MRIAATRITMDFFNNTNASEKRRLLAELCEDLRKQFNVSALEIDEFDDPEKCVIGFAAVIPNNWRESSIPTFSTKVCEYIDTHSFARVTLEESDITAI
ncbi:MAG: DUF503 family protein [Bdellovibrionales bacterium]|nr:DUF503 family protein [Bdellovibrionales bacterium]